ncbi:MAG: Asp-tRNA(Asn)/Glu-tRNA(Gln) amidotransferase subunit GatC [Candidatus Dormibacteria bacterium]
MAAEAANSSPTSSLGAAEVARLSELARLGLTAEELELIGGQLRTIVGAVDQMAEVDVSQLAATAQVGELRNVMRPDQPGTPLSQAEALANAAATEAGFLRVPAIQ